MQHTKDELAESWTHDMRGIGMGGGAKADALDEEMDEEFEQGTEQEFPCSPGKRISIPPLKNIMSQVLSCRTLVCSRQHHGVR